MLKKKKKKNQQGHLIHPWFCVFILIAYLLEKASLFLDNTCFETALLTKVCLVNIDEIILECIKHIGIH